MRYFLGSLMAVSALGGLASPAIAQDPEPDEALPPVQAITLEERRDPNGELPYAGLVTTLVRISPDIVERRAEIVAAIESVEGMLVGEPAEFQVVPNPEFFEHLLFSRIRRIPIDRMSQLYPAVEMDIADIMTANNPNSGTVMFVSDDQGNKFTVPNVPDGPRWGREIPVPVELGPADGDNLAVDLQDALRPIARHHALLGLVNDQHKELEVCIGNSLSEEVFYCDFGEGGNSDRLNFYEPVFVRAMARGEGGRDYGWITILAIGPDRATSVLVSSAVTAVAELTPDDMPPRTVVYADNYATPVDLTELGDYQIIALATREALDPGVFDIQPGQETLPADICASDQALLVCNAMRGLYVKTGEGEIGTGIKSTFVYSDRAFGVAPVGGGLASRAEGKWQAQLFKPRPGPALGVSGDPSPGGAQRLNFEKSHRCGGSYIGGGLVLTAAHCVDRYRNGELQVRLGTLDIAVGGSNFPIVSTVIHSDYGKSRGNADIALLKIRTDSRLARLQRKGLVGSVALAAPNQRLPNGSNVMVTGWGYTSASDGVGDERLDSEGLTQRNARYLTKVELDTRPKGECTRFREMSSFLPQHIICGRSPEEGVDACYTDSGGPMTRRVGRTYQLVGIVSAGIGCAKPGVPGVYTRVAAFRGWIERAKQWANTPGKHYVDQNGRKVR